MSLKTVLAIALATFGAQNVFAQNPAFKVYYEQALQVNITGTIAPEITTARCAMVEKRVPEEVNSQILRQGPLPLELRIVNNHGLAGVGLNLQYDGRHELKNIKIKHIVLDEYGTRIRNEGTKINIGDSKVLSEALKTGTMPLPIKLTTTGRTDVIAATYELANSKKTGSYKITRTSEYSRITCVCE